MYTIRVNARSKLVPSFVGRTSYSPSLNYRFAPKLVSGYRRSVYENGWTTHDRVLLGVEVVSTPSSSLDKYYTSKE